ncbi:MAG: MAPEG family protein [Candidatus Binatia bacterium]
MAAHPMTVPLWCLVALVVWTIGLVVALSVARLRHLAAGGSVRDFGVPDDRRLIWRLFRAHVNSVENLPLFASVVLVATVRGVSGLALDALAIVYLAARVGQSIVHVTPGGGLRGNRRFAFFVAQLACLLLLAAVAVAPS